MNASNLIPQIPKDEQPEIRLVLGQLKTHDKSNEITVIPELIKTLSLQGAVVTIDAMGCQKKITQTTIEEKADYVIQVKGNQPNLHEDIDWFQEKELWAGMKTICKVTRVREVNGNTSTEDAYLISSLQNNASIIGMWLFV